MPKEIDLRLPPSDVNNSELLKEKVCSQLNLKLDLIDDVKIVKRSIDARQRDIWINLKVVVSIGEGLLPIEDYSLKPNDVNASDSVVVVGSGPAGLFAAIKLIEMGLKPIIIERGKDVRQRRRDLVKITREQKVDPNSNYCFGEGGAGTYSDGKLYTRSGNKKWVREILKTFVAFGANEDILIEAHPHIGTNKLPEIIQNMRNYILNCGGEIHFETKMTGLDIQNGEVKGIVDDNNKSFSGSAVILATGHSARDVFELMKASEVQMEFKSFAMGVRVEHPQKFVDSIRYHTEDRGENLPPAAYSLVSQVGNKGVYSFCMCPGGIIAPCATEDGEVVTNGWSPSKRNNPYANSGIVTQVEWEDIPEFHKYGEFAGLEFQRFVERRCWESAGKSQAVPGQRLTDFMKGLKSESLPECSYHPGVVSVRIDQLLPDFISKRLKTGFLSFEVKMKGFISEKAIIVAPESRTSSPIRILRDKETLMSPTLKGLFPCGEGAGFAGGIVSAAIDGEKVASSVASFVSRGQ